MATVYIIMGVSGCGKSSVGQSLAEQRGVPFYDGDDFHPPENVAKMSNGIPLNDDDRRPWLARLHDLIADHLTRDASAVLACSALKRTYRDQLREGNAGVQFVYLDGDFDLIWGRMSDREGHYMKASMLESQFEALEPPTPDEGAWHIPIQDTVAEVVAALQVRINAEKK
jgi:gluconokinase